MCCPRPSLGPWSWGIWGLCWCPRPLLSQGAIGSMHVEIWGPSWATPPFTDLGIAGTAPCWILQQERWSHRALESWPYDMNLGVLAPPLAWGGKSHWPRLTSSATAQTHTLGLQLTDSNIYPIYDLLCRIKGLVFQNGSHRDPMTQGNRRISKRRFGEGPVTMMCYRLESRLMTHCNEKLWVGEVRKQTNDSL